MMHKRYLAIVFFPLILLLVSTLVSAEWIEFPPGSGSGGGISATIPSDFSSRPSVAIDNEGHPIIAWQEGSESSYDPNDDTGYRIYIKRYNGRVWVEVGEGSASGGGIGSNIQSSIRPSLALDSNNNPVVAWLNKYSQFSSSGDIYIKRYDGTSWVEVGEGSASGGGINGGTRSSTYPLIAIAPNGDIFITWQDNGNIFVRRYDGTSWLEVGDYIIGGGPSLVIGSDNNPVVAYVVPGAGAINREIYIMRFDGTNWVEVGQGSASGGGVSNDPLTSRFPSLAIDPDGNPVVAYSGRGIFVKRFNGLRWVTIGTGIDGDIPSLGGMIPSLAIGPDGHPVVASHGTEVIYVKRYNGESWDVFDGTDPDGGMDGTTGPASFPSLALDADGYPIVAWADQSTYNPEIYVKRYVPSITLIVNNGFNLLSLPLENADDTPIQKFLERLGCSLGYRFSAGTFTVHSTDYPSLNNWAMNPADGYFIYCENLEEATRTTFRGSLMQSSVLNLNPGFNLIGIPVVNDHTASSFISLAASQEVDVQIMYSWTGDSYELYLINDDGVGVGTDFSLEPGKGYWVYSPTGGEVIIG